MEFGEEIQDLLVRDKSVSSLSWNKIDEGFEQISLRLWSPLNGAMTSEKVLQVETWPDQAFIAEDEAYLIYVDDKVIFSYFRSHIYIFFRVLLKITCAPPFP